MINGLDALYPHMDDLLREAAARAARYRNDVEVDPIRPEPGADLSELDPWLWPAGSRWG